MQPVYLDYNATTPIDPEVAAAMQPYLVEHFGNPSSGHVYGRRTHEAVETARRQVAALLQCDPEEVIFTSGGSESNNYAIKGAALAHRDRGNHIITSTIEHPAVIEVCKYLETKDFEVTYVPVDADGLIDVQALEQAIRPETILITVMHANNEVGTIQPIAEIARLAKSRGILLHTDAAQSVGKIPTSVDALGVDLLTIAGHKVYAPKGIGALYMRRGTRLEKLMHGADHERHHRAGTENVLCIVGLGQACEIAARDLMTNMAHMQHMRGRLEDGIRQQVEALKINGHAERRLPNTLSVSFPHIEANQLLDAMAGVAASSGAACHSGDVEVSAVLAAMRVPLAYAMGTLRFSTGRMTTAADIDRAVAEVVDAVQRLASTTAMPAP
jgi:cysteine desulfurase NifS